MKIKQLLAQIAIGLLVLMTVKELVGGFVFSKSTTYVLLFLVLFSFTAWVAMRVQIFFLLPKILPFSILLHSIAIAIVFYVESKFIGGIAIVAMQKGFIQLFSKPIGQQLLGEFGTIGMVSFLIGIVYQVIIWLINEK